MRSTTSVSPKPHRTPITAAHILQIIGYERDWGIFSTSLVICVPKGRSERARRALRSAYTVQERRTDVVVFRPIYTEKICLLLTY
ncbi:hypothetical protein AG1IA_04875 [Rhizoctonia solani AG-1 IA]|uniref:Uncharacterized protein n=1 Tax=Thanatephorus cucumeris (strain AG1-IA) TaxID=983506 RepID=L8WXK1_THACA|nr:hypothetical protein AG1IA_04875 [Rhizoctonia solani AG-1 IA]